MIKKFILFIILAINSLAIEINEETITKYIYIKPETKQEYKVTRGVNYYEIKLTPENIVKLSFKKCDDILAYIKRENLIISRKKNTLQICEIDRCKCEKNRK